MLTEDDKRLVQLAFYEGPAALIEDGFAPADLRKFFEREDVQYELSFLKREYDLHEGLKSRAKFVARRGIHRMVEPAMAVLLQTLAGPEYKRDEKTKTVLRDSRGYPMLVNPEPTLGQRWAVDKILQGVGLNDFRIVSDPGADNHVEMLFRKAESPRTIDVTPLGQTTEEQTLSRERVREAIQLLIPKLGGAREQFRKEFAEVMRDGRGGARTPKKTAKKAKKSRKVPRRGKES